MECMDRTTFDLLALFSLSVRCLSWNRCGTDSSGLTPSDPRSVYSEQALHHVVRTCVLGSLPKHSSHSLYGLPSDGFTPALQMRLQLPTCLQGAGRASVLAFCSKLLSGGTGVLSQRRSAVYLYMRVGVCRLSASMVLRTVADNGCRGVNVSDSLLVLGVCGQVSS